MKNIKDYLLKRIAHAEKRIKIYKNFHGDNPSETHTYFAGQNLGYWQGKLSAYENILDEIQESIKTEEFDDDVIRTNSDF